ncbi:phosphatidylserine decarboxylase-domain-containing protein [Spinellus fusiger]|nr:phosphatidylserine decarboxylase-domain-containing protein [Spinellus fusiger]
MQSSRSSLNEDPQKDLHTVQFHNSTVGVVFLDIMHANNLPPIKNVTHTRFDMDPFVIVTYGTSTFRTQAMRHSLDPVWNEKLFFHVRQHEENYRLKFAIYDKDRFSTNDYIAFQEIPISDLLQKKSFNEKEPVDANMQEHTFSLVLANAEEWKDVHSTLTVRVKFMPYSELRRTFWLTLANAHDVDGNKKMSKLEVSTMLESLGSTLSDTTLNSLWALHNKDPEKESDELTMDEIVDSLEAFMVTRDNAHSSIKKGYTHSSSLEDGYEYTGCEDPSSEDEEPIQESMGVQYSNAPVSCSHEPTLQPFDEKIIRLAKCPICHRPDISNHQQMDILTHVAICASNDWTTMDRFIMGDFVTEAYAQQRWFVKLASKVGYGEYSLDSNNANIIVQDRSTGQLTDERMSVYVRVGMRLIYKGMKTRVQSKTAQRIMKSMSIKQGVRYNSPASVSEIEPFIKFHGLDLSEMLDPLSSFKSFNEFFYRKLKPDARLPDAPQDPSVIVSAADCRMMAFSTVDSATRLWIKGLEFSLDKLLNSAEMGEWFEGGALAIFRLAPQDYHRYHSPIDGVITDIQYVQGQYYTVNPMAIRTTLDVYGENVRCIVSIQSEEFGRVAIVCIGAMMVGSILLTASVNQSLAKGDELGYFAFGGSTIVVLWEKDTVVFDDDLLENAEKPLETLVRVGNHIGRRA